MKGEEEEVGDSGEGKQGGGRVDSTVQSKREDGSAEVNYNCDWRKHRIWIVNDGKHGMTATRRLLESEQPSSRVY